MAKAVSFELADRSGLPQYKVAKMTTHLCKLIVSELRMGRQVVLPGLGTFVAKTRKAKIQRNVITGVPNVRTIKPIPQRRELVFVPYKSKRYI